MSRWSNWTVGLERKRYFQDVLKEAGQPMQGDPEEIAQQNGWTSKGYGWYQDAQGQVVARSLDGTMYYYETPPNEVDKQVDTGNPSGAGTGMKPADRARSMGLQSNGRGGYVDPQSGQVVARTVNNELVFYDSRPGGGAVSDGAGGQAMAQQSPSWQDPVTGLVVTPPAKPESAQEIAAIPDPIPAQSPSGYNKFIQQKKLMAYATHKKEYEERKQNEENAEAINAAMAPYQENPDAQQWVSGIMQMVSDAKDSGDEQKMESAEKLLQSVTDQSLPIQSQYLNALNLIRQQGGNAQEQQQQVDELNKIMTRHHIARAKGNQDAAMKYARDLDEIEMEMDAEYQDFLSSEAQGTDWNTSYTGDRVTFNLYQTNERENQAQSDLPIIYDSAKAVGDQYGVQPTSVSEIEWESNDGEGPNEDENRLTALDALKTWRQKVLPSLTPGQVLYNTPKEGGRGGNQRARIYQLAGFSEPSAIGDTNRQWGMVVQDEEGNNRVVPLGEEPDRVNEAFMAFFDMELNTRHMDTLYEHIFDGLPPVEETVTGEPQG